MGEHTKHSTSRVELRERIILAAVELFTTNGIKSITMDEIAASLGISKRTLYEVFPDKETLLEECILKSQKDGDIFVKGVIETSSNVLEVLLRCYQWSIERFHATNKKFFEDIKKYPKAYQLMKNNRNRSSEDTVNFFKEGVKQGIFRDDVNFAIINLLVRDQLDLLMAQEAKDTLTLTLDRALEIALSDNPTIKVAEEEIALKKVTHKETWQNLLPQASIDGTWNHTISAAQMNLGGQSFKMGMDNSNTVSGVLNISLPIFAPSVYKAMSMTKTDIELAVEKSRASKLDLVNQVTKGYYQLMLTQDSYDVLQKSYKLAEDNYNIVNAKYQQGAVSEFDKISAEVQMRSIKPNVISAGNAVTLSKLQLKVLMGVTADVDIEIADNLGNYETELFANELNQPAANLNNNTTMKQLDLNRKMLNQNIKSLREQVVSNRENVMQAQKAVQIAGKRYEVGKGTVLELNTSQVQLTEAELTYNQSIYDYLVAKADLDQVLGKDYIAENEE